MVCTTWSDCVRVMCLPVECGSPNLDQFAKSSLSAGLVLSTVCVLLFLYSPPLPKTSEEESSFFGLLPGWSGRKIEVVIASERHESVPHLCGIGGVVQQQIYLREENLYCLAWGNLGRYIPPLGLIVVGPTATRPLSVNVIGSIRDNPGTSSSSFSSSSSKLWNWDGKQIFTKLPPLTYCSQIYFTRTNYDLSST